MMNDNISGKQRDMNMHEWNVGKSDTVKEENRMCNKILLTEHCISINIYYILKDISKQHKLFPQNMCQEIQMAAGS